MVVRWIIILLLSATFVGAIPRPETKSTLRSLARLPRTQPRFSLDFDADRGFAAFDTSRDPSLVATETREKLTGGLSDGKVYLEIAALRHAAGDANAGRDFQRSADFLRRRLDLEPSNARLRIDLATALHGAGRPSEAESLFREAIRLAPTATNQIAFSVFLEARAWEIAADTSNWRGRRPYAELCWRMLQRQPSAETADRAARLLNESLAAAREAVHLDEDSAEAQHRLAIANASKDCFEAMRRRASGKDSSTQPLENAIFTESALPSLDKAAELDPDNPIRLATAILWRGLAQAAQKRIAIRDSGLWDSLPDEARHRIQIGIDALEQFADSSKSGAAAEALGTLRFVLQNDLHGAADDLRFALGAIPDSEQLWETLSLVLTRARDDFEYAAICEARVMVRPSARNRVLLAAAHEKIGNRARALQELNFAIALNSSDFAANVSLAALLMRDTDDEEEPSPRIRQALINAERSVRTSANGSQLVDLALVQSIYHALIDEPERAREILKAALAYDKDDPAISEALEALGY
jgi:tetratricopeptide (TPR) repeat protein